MAVKSLAGSSLSSPKEPTHEQIDSGTRHLNDSFYPPQEQTTQSSLLARVQSLAIASQQLSERFLELENKYNSRFGELEKRNLDLEQKMNGLVSTFTSLLQFQNTQDQSDMPLYQTPVTPIQSQSLIENNYSEETIPPGFSSSKRAASDEKVASAKYFLNLKDFFCAGRYIDEAIQIDSENAKAFAIKSKICRLQGDFVGSLQAARKATEIDPYNLMALVNKALALRLLGYKDEALKTSEAALSLKPRNQLALRCKLECQFLMGKPLDSLQTIDSTLQHFPNDHVANNIKGLIFNSYPHLQTRQQ